MEPAQTHWLMSVDPTLVVSEVALSSPSRQGLTIIHFSAQRKHILWDTLGA
jgi:hypothetical protein